MTNEKDIKSLTGLIFSKWRTVQTHLSVRTYIVRLIWAFFCFDRLTWCLLSFCLVIPHIVRFTEWANTAGYSPSRIFFNFLLRWYSISESLTNSYYSTKVPKHFSNSLTGPRLVKINLCIKGVGHIKLSNGLIWLPKKCLCLMI